MLIPFEDDSDLTCTGISLRGQLAQDYLKVRPKNLLEWVANTNNYKEVLKFYDDENGKLTFGYKEDRGTLGEDW